MISDAGSSFTKLTPDVIEAFYSGDTSDRSEIRREVDHSLSLYRHSISLRSEIEMTAERIIDGGIDMLAPWLIRLMTRMLRIGWFCRGAVMEGKLLEALYGEPATGATDMSAANSTGWSDVSRDGALALLRRWKDQRKRLLVRVGGVGDIRALCQGCLDSRFEDLGIIDVYDVDRHRKSPVLQVRLKGARIFATENAPAGIWASELGEVYIEALYIGLPGDEISVTLYETLGEPVPLEARG